MFRHIKLVAFNNKISFILFYFMGCYMKNISHYQTNV